MLTRDRASIRILIAAAGLACAGFSPVARASDGSTPPIAGEEATARAILDQAADLLASNQVVRARALLIPLTGRDNVSLTGAERQRLYSLLANATARVKSLGPVEASVQHAEDALLREDLVEADRHAEAVIEAPKATNAQVMRARRVKEDAAAKRLEVAHAIPVMLTQATDALDEGRADAARALVERVARLGLVLPAGDAESLDALRGRILGVEGQMANAAAFQPGVIRRRESGEQVAQAQPEAQPATQPAPAQPAPQQPDVIQQAQQFEAASILGDADFAFEQGRLTDAAAGYRRVLSAYAGVISAEQRARAEQRLAEANARLNVNPGQGADILGGALRANQIAREQTIAEFTNDMEQARRALAGGDPGRARDLAAAANLRLSAGRQYLSATEFEERKREVDALRTQIDGEENRIRAAQAAERERLLADEARRREAEVARSKEERIAQSLQRVRALQREMKYEEALQVIDQVLFLDPINPSALVLRDVLQDVIISLRAQNYIDRRARGVTHQRVENLGAIVPPENILDFPEDWPAISERRGEPVAFADTEDNRRALAVLENKRIPVEFVDTPLSSVLGFIQAVTNLNVDVDYQSLESVGIDRESIVSLKLSNATVRTVLDRVLEKVSNGASSGAAWSVNDGILVVASQEVINRNKTLVIYDIRDLLVEVPDYTNVPDFDLQSVLQNTGQGGGGGQSPFQDNNDADVPRRSLEDRTNDLINIITTNVDPQGWQENGGDVGFIQQLQGNLIITQTPANHRAIHGLLAKLRESRAMQINVETRFLLVSQDFFEQVGVDIDVYFNGRNNQVRTARGVIPTLRPSDLFDPNTGRLSPTYPTSGVGANANRTPLPSPLSVIGAGQNSLGLAESLIQSDFGSGIISGAPALGVAGQFLDDIQVDFLVKATQADRRTVTLTAPRLTFTNGQTSNIYVATQVSFVSGLTPVVSESAVGFDPQLGVVNEGVRLLVDGTISADRRYVTLNVDASVAKIEGFASIPVTAVAGGQLVNSADTQSFIQTPTTTVTRVQTTVTVPDQGTILLGGQRLITESEVESGVPVLSKIPILNRFFSNRVMAKEEQTLLILLKPTILIQSEEEERNYPGLADSIRMPFGG